MSTAESSIVVESVESRPVSTRQWVLAGIIALLGGYLTLMSVGGTLVQQLAGFTGAGVELTVLLVGQLVFGVAVTLLGYFVAPGSLGRRVQASIIFIAAVVLTISFLVLRITGNLQALGEIGNIPVGISIANPYFMVLLFGGLSWFIAAGSRGIAYLALLLPFALMPVGYLMALNQIPSALSIFIQLVAELVVAVIFLLISRPRTEQIVEVVDVDDVDAVDEADEAVLIAPPVDPVEATPAAAPAPKSPRAPRAPKAPAAAAAKPARAPRAPKPPADPTPDA